MSSEKETLIIVGDLDAKVNWLVEESARLLIAEGAGLNRDVQLDGRSELLAGEKGQETALVDFDLRVESGAEAMVEAELHLADLSALNLELLLKG